MVKFPPSQSLLYWNRILDTSSLPEDLPKLYLAQYLRQDHLKLHHKSIHIICIRIFSICYSIKKNVSQNSHFGILNYLIIGYQHFLIDTLQHQQVCPSCLHHLYSNQPGKLHHDLRGNQAHQPYATSRRHFYPMVNH